MKKLLITAMTVAASLGVVGVNAFAASGGSGSSWVGSVDVSPIVDNITAAVPVVLPALISILAIRKGVSFVIGTIRRG